MQTQIYEDYWEITNAFTNYNGEKFLTTLKICVEFIDEFKSEAPSEEKYARLQNKINDALPKNFASIRKSINQLSKLGFIGSFLKSYHPDAVKYLDAKTNKKRQSLLSKIVYSSSSFSRSYEKVSIYNHVNFIIKTLEEVGNLTKEDIKGLMIVNINNHKIGYLTRNEIDKYINLANNGAFDERKFNQIGYLWNLLKKLDDLVVIDKKLYFEEDAKVIFGEDLKQETKKRDGYLHRIYKNQLKEESEEKLTQTQCMLEKLSYPSLVASHIKPFIQCSNDDEAYDPNNGLLLSRNMDILFDQGYISFNDDGTIIYSPQLNQDVTTHLDNYKLDSIFINENRIQYFDYHRNNIFRKSA